MAKSLIGLTKAADCNSKGQLRANYVGWTEAIALLDDKSNKIANAMTRRDLSGFPLFRVTLKLGVRCKLIAKYKKRGGHSAAYLTVASASSLSSVATFNLLLLTTTTMFEARLAQASILKKVLDALKELVTDVNFECNEEGLNLQAMDNSHVALVSVKLESTGFATYRCDRPMPLGTNLLSLSKVLKCAKDDDQVTLKANDNADVLYLKYEAKSTRLSLITIASDARYSP